MRINAFFSLVIIAAIALAAPSARSANVQQGGYSVAPLQSPIFDEAQVVVETTALNNWLNANIQKLTYDQMKGPREHLYYLIDSRVKQIYAAEGHVLPQKPDPIIEILFSWPEYLGVFGGAQVFNAVKASTSSAKTLGMKLPQGMSLTLNKDMFSLHSDSGWTIGFPYYFMIWNIGDFTAKGGPRTQLVALSTGAAKDKSQAGRSQATLMFLFSPGGDFETFEHYWAGQIGVGAQLPSKPLNVKKLRSRHTVDQATKLHKEFTTWSEPSGSYGVVYLGIEGTYEWNRPHFIDFLRFIQTVAETRPNNSFKADCPDGPQP